MGLEIKRVKVEVGNNGFMVEWEQVITTKKPGQEYDNRTYSTKNELFAKTDDETIDQCLDRALVKFKEMFKQSTEFQEKAEDVY